jgi:hypothetical protein
MGEVPDLLKMNRITWTGEGWTGAGWTGVTGWAAKPVNLSNLACVEFAFDAAPMERGSGAFDRLEGSTAAAKTD